MILQLVIQFFLSVTLVLGLSMFIFTLGYREKLRKHERLGRYLFGVLLIYSVIMRYMIMLPGPFPYMKEMSVGFDILYISICICFNINLLKRR